MAATAVAQTYPGKPIRIIAAQTAGGAFAQQGEKLGKVSFPTSCDPWTESVATNRRSAFTARQSNEPDEALHATDYMVYAYLQMARDGDAKKVIEEAQTVGGLNPARNTGPYALAAMSARYAIERSGWSGAMTLQPHANKFLYTEALTRFARALGAARSGDPAAAEKGVQQLASLHDALKATKNAYWATEVEVNRLAAAAWTALAQGSNDEALNLMRGAADTDPTPPRRT